MSRYSILTLFALLLGCASAEKRYEQAQQAEAEGRWADAADHYIDALRRDPEYPGAHEGLRASGRRAVDDYLASARNFENAGRHDKAVEEFKRIDGLIDRAAAARVTLEVPSDYAERRRMVYDRALEAALSAADALAAAGRFDEAANGYRAAENSYDPSPQQSARARDGRYRALLGAARHALDAHESNVAQSFVDQALAVYGAAAPESAAARELGTLILESRYRGLLEVVQERSADGRYQEAYRYVEQALGVYGPEAEASADARALRDKVIAEGSVRMAAAPVCEGERAGDGVPAGLLDDVNDLLEDESWSKPPLFVASLDAKSVREALRALGLERRIITNDQAAALGGHLDADFVVLTYVRRSVVGGAEREAEIVKLATQNAADAQMHIYPRRTLVVECVLRIVQAADRQAVAETSVRVEVERKMRYAVLKGEAKDLLLTEEQHRLLDPRRLREADRELEKDASAALAKAIGATAYRELLKQLR